MTHIWLVTKSARADILANGCSQKAVLSNEFPS